MSHPKPIKSSSAPSLRSQFSVIHDTKRSPPEGWLATAATRGIGGAREALGAEPGAGVGIGTDAGTGICADVFPSSFFSSFSTRLRKLSSITRSMMPSIISMIPSIYAAVLHVSLGPLLIDVDSGTTPRSFGRHSKYFFYRRNALRRFKNAILCHCEHALLFCLRVDLICSAVFYYQLFDRRGDGEDFVNSDAPRIASRRVDAALRHIERHGLPRCVFRDDLLLL